MSSKIVSLPFGLAFWDDVLGPI
ncbi:uncharacterized protein FTOL_13377 [Fusarium torulosum]|uniref:Uncharacterized protein n=1 Tax=Fusarium torulosum TaxID=33205 RepID=A0AAE8MM21_9HYPO|nr:uncharacterized protein FTOL_13377 [Fusarium torulosum]